MSVGRSFLINELRRLELRFHPDGANDELAVEYIRAAIKILTEPHVKQEKQAEPPARPQLRSKAS